MDTPVSTSSPVPYELKQTEVLKRILCCYDLYETDEEMVYKKAIIREMESLLDTWMQHINTEKHKADAKGKMLVFGSYRMGIQTKGSDIDLLFVAPRHVDRSDFFTSFARILKEHEEVHNLKVIPEAFVPIITFEFKGINIDLLFARSSLKSVPKDFETTDIDLKHLDEKCIRSLNEQGIYSNMIGFVGGASWAMLVAKTCQLYPNACASTIVQKFFLLFTNWSWPNAVYIKRQPQNTLGLKVWDSKVNRKDRLDLMPIISPSYPQINSSFNVTKSTLEVMKACFVKGHTIVNGIMLKKYKWDALFQEMDFFSMYKCFIVIIVSASNSEDLLIWNGLVQSRIRFLIQDVEKHVELKLIHINSKSFSPVTSEFDATKSSLWFCGLDFLKKEKVSLDLTSDVQRFSDFVTDIAKKAKTYKSSMKLQVNFIKRKDLVKYLPESIYKGKKNKMDVLGIGSRKRPFQDATNSPDLKRLCT